MWGGGGGQLVFIMSKQSEWAHLVCYMKSLIGDIMLCRVNVNPLAIYKLLVGVTHTLY